MSTITTIDEEMLEVDRTKQSMAHGAAQAKVLSLRLRAKGDLRGADLARQLADKLDQGIYMCNDILGDLAYRKQMLVQLAADHIHEEFAKQTETWIDEDDFRMSEASDR